MADFTTWAALKTQILNALSNGSILTEEYEITGRRRRFRSLKEVREMLDYCDMMTGSTTEGGLTAYASFKKSGDGL